jgi:hypothetical protein
VGCCSYGQNSYGRRLRWLCSVLSVLHLSVESFLLRFSYERFQLFEQEIGSCHEILLLDSWGNIICFAPPIYVCVVCRTHGINLQESLSVVPPTFSFFFFKLLNKYQRNLCLEVGTESYYGNVMLRLLSLGDITTCNLLDGCVSFG